MQVLTLQEVQERLRIGRRAMRYLIDQDEDFVTMKLGARRVMTDRAFNDFVEAKERQSRPHKR